MRGRLGAAILILATPAVAGNFLLEQPIDCELGESCFIQQYVDRDPGPGSKDFACGFLSYDGHKGTDFALPDLKAMTTGVKVLAAADGVVLGIRDGEPDTGASGAQPGKECGNGVSLEHGDGWVTQYCHLKRGSVAVSRGQTVTAGTPLGQVGLSGRTEFPHLHISLRHHGKVVDPFSPSNAQSCTEPQENSLWASDIPYVPGGLISIGLSDAVPSFDAIKSGTLLPLQAAQESAAFVLYAHLFGTQSGDVVMLQLSGPDGTEFVHELTMERNQARSFRAVGRRKPEAGWPVGDYIGSATLTRSSRVITQKSLEFIVR